MNLYLVHCGFYDAAISDGLYESHINFFVAAENFDDAKIKAKQNSEFQNKKMHIDGLQEIQAVNGYKISLTQNSALSNQTVLVNLKHRDLAPKAKT